MAAAISDEVARLAAIDDPAQAVNEVTDVFNALEDALDEVAEVRLRALAQMKKTRSLNKIVEETVLSKSRVAQLVREARRQGL